MPWLDHGGIDAINGGRYGEAEMLGNGPIAASLLQDLEDAIPSLTRPGFLDQTPPNMTVVSDSTLRVSRVVGHDTDIVTFSSDKDFQAWRIEQVTNATDPSFSGTLLASGGEGTAGNNVAANVTGEAMSGIDGAKLVKVFAQDYAGNWST